MSQMIKTSLTVNGKRQTVTALPDTPLLWVLRENLKLTGTKFGCGAGQCGACLVHVDGKSVFSCLLPISQMSGRNITTIEGLAPDSNHKLQKAWVAEQVPQCGYCQSGQIMRAADLLKTNPHPTREQIAECTLRAPTSAGVGLYARIVKAVERAAKEA